MIAIIVTVVLVAGTDHYRAGTGAWETNVILARNAGLYARDNR